MEEDTELIQNGLNISRTGKKAIENKKVLCLIDGEHYPSSVNWTLDKIEELAGSLVGSVFIGGKEKIFEKTR